MTDNNLTSTHATLFGKRKLQFAIRALFLQYFIVIFLITVFAFSREKILGFFCSLSGWGIISSIFYFGFVILDRLRSQRFENFCRLFNFLKFVSDFQKLLLFWTYVIPYSMERFENEEHGWLKYFGIFAWYHAPFVTILIDTIQNRHEFHMSLWFFNQIYFSLFFIFNAIYAWCNEKPVYPYILTWKDWWTVLTIFVFFILTYLVSLVLFYSKNWCYSKRVKRCYEKSETEQKVRNESYDDLF